MARRKRVDLEEELVEITAEIGMLLKRKEHLLRMLSAPVNLQSSLLNGTSTEVLEFKGRIKLCLDAAGIKTVEALCRLSENDLLAMHKMGPKNIDHIKEVLAVRGLELAKNK